MVAQVQVHVYFSEQLTSMLHVLSFYMSTINSEKQTQSYSDEHGNVGYRPICLQTSQWLPKWGAATSINLH